MTRRLLVFDELDVKWLDRVLAVTAFGDEWHLLLLGHSQVWFRRRFREKLAQLGCWQMVDLEALASEANARVRDFVLAFVEHLPDQDLGGETLAELLSTREGNHWWYLEISEKSPWRGRWVDQLYRLALVRLAVEQNAYAEVWLAVSEVPLRDVLAQGADAFPPVVVLAVPPSSSKSWRNYPLLAYGIRALWGMLQFWLNRLLLVLARGLATSCPAHSAFLIASFYPFWWINPYSPETTERFFGAPLERPLTYFLVWLTRPYELWRQRWSVAEVVRTRKLIPLQCFVSFWAALRLLNPVWFARLWRFERDLRPYLKADFAGFEVSELVRAEVSRSLSSGAIILAQFIALAFDSVARRIPCGVLMYRVEYQPWESAMLFGMRGRLKTIGYQHIPLGPSYLPMQFVPGELPRYVKRERPQRDRPLSDRLLVSGLIGVEHLRHEGYPLDRVTICGPQRHSGLRAHLQQRPSRAELRSRLNWPGDVPVIFVAISLWEPDTHALFGALTEAGMDAGDFRLVVKTHPAKPLEEAAMQETFDALGQHRCSIVPPRGNMYDYIAAADVMVCVGSSIAFEAMALGVMPIVFENPVTFAMNSLADFRAALFVARNGIELRAALLAVLEDSGEAQAKRKAWCETLAYVFHDLVTPLPEQLRAALKNAGVGMEFDV